MVTNTIDKIGLQPAQLEWRDGLPYSKQFADVYFSADDGVAETEYVFLQGNALAERWSANTNTGTATHFVIGETGFGTGLNMLLAWQLWQQTRVANSASTVKHLHLVSIEKHPLTKADLAQALHTISQRWPGLTEYCQRLLAAYPPLMPGRYRLYLDDATTLTLIFDDVKSALPQLNARVDAWFLDGFAPAKNASMWQPEHYNALFRWSAPQATLATFTAAGHVRRGLQAAGFVMQKMPGFGRKRDMLQGRRQGRQHGRLYESKPIDVLQPQKPAVRLPKTALIIGAGLAGAGAAHALARYGVQCQVIDANQQPAAAASGVPAAALRPYFDALWQTPSRLYATGYAFTAQHPACDYQRTGVLKVANVEAEAARQQRLQKRLILPDDFLAFVDAEQASKLLGLPCEFSGYWLAESGWCQPAAVVKQLLQHPLITVQLNTNITSLKKIGDDTEPQWQASNEHGDTVAQADVVLMCTGAATQLLPSQLAEALRPIRGQVERTHLAVAHANSLQTVFNHRGYVVANEAGEVFVGASFVSGEKSTEPSAEESAENFAKLAEVLPDLQLDNSQIPWVGIRAKCPGHLPIIGQINAPADDAKLSSGLYLSTAHGARGLCTALFAGEHLASDILQMPVGFEAQVEKACTPSRFD